LNDQRLNIWILNPQNNTYGSNPNQIILIGGVILSADYSDMESIITVGLQSGDLNVYFYSPDSNNYFSFQNISQASSNGVQTVAISGDSIMIATSGSDQFTTLYELSGNFQQSSRVQRWGSSLDFNNISQLAIG
jgi:WD40 repeat protein